MKILNTDRQQVGGRFVFDFKPCPSTLKLGTQVYRIWYTSTVGNKPRHGKEPAAHPQPPATQGKRVPAIFFRTESGREPVRDWLKSLPAPEDKKRIGEDIKTVEFGWPVGMPVCKPLAKGFMK